MTEKTTIMGVFLALLVAGLVGAGLFAKFFSVAPAAPTKFDSAYLQGKKAGIVESICAEKTGQYDPYVRRYFPIQQDPRVEAIEKCELCKKGLRK